MAQSNSPPTSPTTATANSPAADRSGVEKEAAEPATEATPAGAKKKEEAPTSAGSETPKAPPASTADKGPELDHVPDNALEKYRTPLEVLMERAIGRTSRRIRYDWRRSTVQVGGTVALPAELNSFDSIRSGVTFRMPYDGLLLEAGVSRVWVAGSTSTERLALTPYRQPGRPDRYELDFALAYPLAEGIVTAFPAFVPATELVFNAYAHFRYLIYPAAFADLSTKDTLKALVAGQLSERELSNLEEHRLPGMELDPGRYGLLVGLGNDLYFQSGLFISPRILVGIPLLSFMTDSRLRFYLEGVLSMGLSF